MICLFCREAAEAAERQRLAALEQQRLEELRRQEASKAKLWYLRLRGC